MSLSGYTVAAGAAPPGQRGWSVAAGWERPPRVERRRGCSASAAAASPRLQGRPGPCEMTHPNQRLLTSLDAAEDRSDLEAYLGLLADDFAMHIPGRSRIAGDYRGKDAMRRHFGEIAEPSGGTCRTAVHDILATDDHAVGLITARAERAGRIVDLPRVHVSPGAESQQAVAAFDAIDAGDVRQPLPLRATERERRLARVREDRPREGERRVLEEIRVERALRECEPRRERRRTGERERPRAAGEVLLDEEVGDAAEMVAVKV